VNTRRWLALLGWLALAVGGGVVWGLQFGREGHWIAPWLALAPLFLLLAHRRSGWLAWLHGTAAWVAAIPWITPTLITYGKVPRHLAVLGLLMLSVYLGSFAGVFGALGGRIWRRAGRSRLDFAVVLLGLPALWIALEWVREWLLSGFPWNLTAYAAIEVPGVLASSAWLGVWLLGFVVAFANAAFALAAAHRRWEVAALGVLLPAILLATAGRWAAGVADVAGPPRSVRVLQPNIENLTAWDPAIVQTHYEKVFRLSEDLCDRPGALIVWPESAAWPYSYTRNPSFRIDIDRLAARGCPVLFNSSHEESEGVWYNSAFLVADGETAVRYDKRHLVPFGEYVPFGGIIPFVDRLARNAGDFSPAPEIRLLPWGSEALGMAICFEVTFPDEVSATVQAGATVLVTLTNDAWYGDTAAPWQHLRAARFRAAENRRPLLRSAITGVSAVIAPDGSVQGQLGVGKEGVLKAWVTGRKDLSPASRWPWLGPACCLLLAFFAIFRGHRDPSPRPRQGSNQATGE